MPNTHLKAGRIPKYRRVDPNYPYVQLLHPERMANVAPTPVARPIITDSVVKVRGGGTKKFTIGDMPLPVLKGMQGIDGWDAKMKSKAVGMPGLGIQPRNTRVTV